MAKLGTSRKNKPVYPEEMPNKEVHSSLFCFTEDIAVVNYTPKKNKSVILMSTLHRGKESEPMPPPLRPRVSSTNVLNRVGEQQDKWKRQVQEQRRNIYDRHTMLN
ncbi:uncharacterized protein CG1161 [Trichonephila clavipes]|nr:uncharacterized protein CG1161 [Trichonephila clavipes]